MYSFSQNKSSSPSSSSFSYTSSTMSVSGIQGHLLEITVIGCHKLKDTEWFSRQDPYVIVEYGSNKSRTRTCTDGGKNPTFQEKFVFTLIEGLREINLAVWNSNTLTYDDFIGSGKVQLQKVLSEGYDDSSWPLQTKTGRYAGDVRLILHYPNAKKSATSFTPAPPYAAPTPAPHASMYSQPPPASGATYAPVATAYSNPSPYPSYPPNSAYPPSAYPPPPAAYPPSPYPSHSAYPPSPYPPPPHSSHYHPPGPFPGLYPPPPY